MSDRRRGRSSERHGLPADPFRSQSADSRHHSRQQGQQGQHYTMRSSSPDVRRRRNQSPARQMRAVPMSSFRYEYNLPPSEPIYHDIEQDRLHSRSVSPSRRTFNYADPRNFDHGPPPSKKEQQKPVRSSKTPTIKSSRSFPQATTAPRPTKKPEDDKPSLIMFSDAFADTGSVLTGWSDQDLLRKQKSPSKKHKYAKKKDKKKKEARILNMPSLSHNKRASDKFTSNEPSSGRNRRSYALGVDEPSEQQNVKPEHKPNAKPRGLMAWAHKKTAPLAPPQEGSSTPSTKWRILSSVSRSSEDLESAPSSTGSPGVPEVDNAISYPSLPIDTSAPQETKRAMQKQAEEQWRRSQDEVNISQLSGATEPTSNTGVVREVNVSQSSGATVPTGVVRERPDEKDDESPLRSAEIAAWLARDEHKGPRANNDPLSPASEASATSVDLWKGKLGSQARFASSVQYSDGSTKQLREPPKLQPPREQRPGEDIPAKERSPKHDVSADPIIRKGTIAKKNRSPHHDGSDKSRHESPVSVTVVQNKNTNPFDEIQEDISGASSERRHKVYPKSKHPNSILRTPRRTRQVVPYDEQGSRIARVKFKEDLTGLQTQTFTIEDAEFDSFDEGNHLFQENTAAREEHYSVPFTAQHTGAFPSFTDAVHQPEKDTIGKDGRTTTPASMAKSRAYRERNHVEAPPMKATHRSHTEERESMAFPKEDRSKTEHFAAGPEGVHNWILGQASPEKADKGRYEARDANPSNETESETELLDFIETVAAIVIQTAFRRHIARSVIAELRAEKFERRAIRMYELAAIRIQSVFRGWWTRDCLAVDDYCATRIQSAARGYIYRMSYLFDVFRIIIIQSLWRRRLAFDSAAERLSNVIAIQSVYRGYETRKRLPHNDEIIPTEQDFAVYHEAATVIQSRWRMYDAQMYYLSDLAGILIAQSAVRRWMVKTRIVPSLLAGQAELNGHEDTCLSKGVPENTEGLHFRPVYTDADQQVYASPDSSFEDVEHFDSLSESETKDETEGRIDQGNDMITLDRVKSWQDREHAKAKMSSHAANFWKQKSRESNNSGHKPRPSVGLEARTLPTYNVQLSEESNDSGNLPTCSVQLSEENKNSVISPLPFSAPDHSDQPNQQGEPKSSQPAGTSVSDLPPARSSQSVDTPPIDLDTGTEDDLPLVEDRAMSVPHRESVETARVTSQVRTTSDNLQDLPPEMRENGSRDVVFPTLTATESREEQTTTTENGSLAHPIEELNELQNIAAIIGHPEDMRHPKWQAHEPQDDTAPDKPSIINTRTVVTEGDSTTRDVKDEEPATTANSEHQNKSPTEEDRPLPQEGEDALTPPSMQRTGSSTSSSFSPKVERQEEEEDGHEEHLQSRAEGTKKLGMLGVWQAREKSHTTPSSCHEKEDGKVQARRTPPTRHGTTKPPASSVQARQGREEEEETPATFSHVVEDPKGNGKDAPAAGSVEESQTTPSEKSFNESPLLVDESGEANERGVSSPGEEAPPDPAPPKVPVDKSVPTMDFSGTEESDEDPRARMIRKLRIIKAWQEGKINEVKF